MTVVSNIGGFETEDDYFAEYFRTDHHWNAVGCARVYNQAASDLGLAEVQVEPQRTFAQNMGSYARNGLVVETEAGVDIAQDFPGVYIIDEKNGRSVPVDDHAWYDEGSEDGFYDFYNRYYRQGSTYISPGEGEALLVCNSFAAPMLAPITANYETVHRVGDLYQRPGTPSLEALIEETDPVDVWIVGIPADMMALVSREPGYFEPLQ